MAKTITAANAKFTIAVLPILPVPFDVEGFGTDDAFTTDAANVAETVKGVDGKMSAGFLPFITEMTVTLQADSASIDIFDQWLAAQKAENEIFFAQGVIVLNAVGKSYTLVKGVLKRVTQFSPVRKTLQPQVYQIDWADVQPVPLATA